MARSYSMSLGMLRKKMSCPWCGKPLIRRKVSNTYRPGDPGFKTFLHGGIINISSYTEVDYVYACLNCHKEITYADQTAVAKMQEQLGRKILTEEEIQNAQKMRAKKASLIYYLLWAGIILLAIIVYVLKRHFQ